ncbi:MAG: COX15/CtaA family protein [Bacteroidota bacterium]
MSQNQKNRANIFKRLSLITLCAVYVLILVGGIVRATGSGMGCPDWPKCFGQWVPPTDVSQLPADYKDVYAQKRNKKNERFAEYLTSLGFKSTAEDILQDESILIEASFNKFKTWTEYINRLVGALIGLLVFATFVSSTAYLKTSKKVFFLSLFTLFLVGFQGWIGSIVVSTNLLPWMVTIHMLIALAIVALLIYLFYVTSRNIEVKKQLDQHKMAMGILVVSMLVLIIQIALGTQVREAVDSIAASLSYANRESWISSLGLDFLIHRSLSILVLLLHVALTFVLMKAYEPDVFLVRLAKGLVAVILGTIISGVILSYFAVPAFAQPIHLFLGTVSFGLQFMVWLRLRSYSTKASLSFN